MLGGVLSAEHARWTSGERERAYRKEGKEGAEADQSPAEPKTADERSRACVSPLSIFTAAESSVRQRETCPKMMLKLVHFLGVLVCGSQGRDVCVECVEPTSFGDFVDKLSVFAIVICSRQRELLERAEGERDRVRGGVRKREREGWIV